MKKKQIEARLEEIFEKGSSKEIETAMTNGKIAERIEERAKREEQLDEWKK